MKKRKIGLGFIYRGEVTGIRCLLPGKTSGLASPPKLHSTLHQAACAQPHHLALSPSRAQLLFPPCVPFILLFSPPRKPSFPVCPSPSPCIHSSSDGPCSRQGKLIEARAQGVCGPRPRGLHELIRLVQTWDFFWNVVLNQGALRTNLGVLKKI